MQHLAVMQCFHICYTLMPASLVTAHCVMPVWLTHIADNMHGLVQVQCNAAVSLIHRYKHDMHEQVMPYVREFNATPTADSTRDVTKAMQATHSVCTGCDYRLYTHNAQADDAKTHVANAAQIQYLMLQRLFRQHIVFAQAVTCSCDSRTQCTGK